MRRAVPLRGDWIELDGSPGVEVPKLPYRRPAWLAATRRQWESWWSDPAAATWGPADRAAVETLAVLVEAFERGDVRLAPEIRLRLDGLALTARGKRDLRYRVVPEEESKPDRSRFESVASFQSSRERLRAVDPRLALAERESIDPRRSLEEG